MAEFMIRFLICNIFISMIIGVLLLAKRLLKKCLTNRMHYNLWFLLLGLLTVPFIPVQPVHVLQIFTWFENLKNASSAPIGTGMKETAPLIRSTTANWMNDFSISVSRKTPSTIGLMLFILWCIGIFIMLVLIVKL